MSVLALPLGLSEPSFVPTYWSPPTLFSSIRTLGFDLESLMFSFSLGGIAVALWTRWDRSTRADVTLGHGWLLRTLPALATPMALYLVLVGLWDASPLWSAVVCMLLGFLIASVGDAGTLLPALAAATIFGAWYWLSESLVGYMSPAFLASIFNPNAMTGLRLGHVPVEEIAFSIAFGLYWPALYRRALVEGSLTASPPPACRTLCLANRPGARGPGPRDTAAAPVHPLRRR